MATQTYGEDELQDLKDVHWKALTVLDTLHKRDRRARKKARERGFSKGAAGLLHRLTKPRAVWCLRDAAQGEATNPGDAAELAAKRQSRIWRVHLASTLWLARSRPKRASVSTRFIPQCGPASQKRLYTDLLNDVERTLTWPAQIQTLI